MKKSIIFLGLFIVMFGWIIQSNVQASTPAELYDKCMETYQFQIC